jgi:hypothetical protein
VYQHGRGQFIFDTFVEFGQHVIQLIGQTLNMKSKPLAINIEKLPISHTRSMKSELGRNRWINALVEVLSS